MLIDDVGRCPLAVDLSNVLRDEQLGLVPNHQAGWSRWERLVTAWRTQYGVAPADVMFVADANLPYYLSRADQSLLEAEGTRGRLLVSADADADLLALAMAEDRIVISRDNFTELLRLPGITDVTACSWLARPDRTIRFTVRSLRPPQSRAMSSRADRELMKRRGLSDDSPVLAQKWACSDVTCPESLVPLPDVTRGDPTCPTCGSYLASQGQWQRPVWVKVMARGIEVDRILLEDGAEAVLGRDPLSGVLGVGIHAGDDGGLISRKHLVLLNEAGKVLATDVSTNGCLVRHPAQGMARGWMPPARWPQGVGQVLRDGDRLYLSTTGVCVELSGRHQPAARRE